MLLFFVMSLEFCVFSGFSLGCFILKESIGRIYFELTSLMAVCLAGWRGVVSRGGVLLRCSGSGSVFWELQRQQRVLGRLCWISEPLARTGPDPHIHVDPNPAAGSLNHPFSLQLRGVWIRVPAAHASFPQVRVSGCFCVMPAGSFGTWCRREPPSPQRRCRSAAPAGGTVTGRTRRSGCAPCGSGWTRWCLGSASWRACGSGSRCSSEPLWRSPGIGRPSWVPRRTSWCSGGSW